MLRRVKNIYVKSIIGDIWMRKVMTSNLTKNVALYVLLFVVSITISLVSLDFLNIDWDAYCSISLDSAATEASIKSIQENGIMGVYFNPRVGAPNAHGSWIDSQGIDVFLNLVILVLNFIFRPSTQRLYYYTLIATFVITSFSMAVLLNKLKYNKLVVFVFSILFSFGPYHFHRYLYHIAIGNAFSVPLSILMCLYLMNLVDTGENSKKIKIEYSLYGILLGLSCPYFAFYGLILLAIAFIFCASDKDKLKIYISRCECIVAFVLSLFLTRLPSIVFNIFNGKNEMSFARSAEQSEVFALKITQLLFPVEYERIPFLRNITSAYYSSPWVIRTENHMSSLGLVASVLFLIATGMFIYTFIKKKDERSSVLKWDIIDFITFSVVALVLVGVTGGFGEIFNIFVTPQFRCYNRISIDIMCLLLVLGACLTDYLMKKKFELGVLIVLIALLVGLFDQVQINDMKELTGQYHNWQSLYSDFYGKVEDDLPEGAMVYQLPFMSYPESDAICDLDRAEQFTAYLYTDDLRFSFGGVVGRDTLAEELNNIDNGKSEDFIDAIKSAGFSGVIVYADGYEDSGEELVTLYTDLGYEPVVSADGRLFYFNIS